MDGMSSKIQENLGLVYTIVGQLFPQHIHNDDIIEIATISLWKAIQTFDEKKERSFSSYLKVIIKNDVLNELKLISRNKAVSLDNLISSNSENAQIVNIADRKLYAMLLAKEYDTLEVMTVMTDRQKEVYLLMLECLTQKEIATNAGISQQNVQQLIKKIRRKVAREWQT